MYHRFRLPLLLIVLLLSGLTALAQENRDPVAQSAVPVLVTADAHYVARGNSVLRLDPETGVPVWRKAVSGPVSLLEENAGGVSVVTRLGDGLTERISIDSQGRASGQVRFSSDPEVLQSLRREAEAATDPLTALATDPTNPWLWALAGAGEPDPEAARELFRAATAAASTFYDLAGIADLMVRAGHHDLAGDAMQLALQDFDRRGYSPHFLTDLELHGAYGFPLPRLRAAINAGDADTAAFWAHWLAAFLSPDVPQVAASLNSWADFLEARGEPAAAEQWRAVAAPDASELAVSGSDRLFLSLGRSGWYMFASLVAVILALQITLTLKYWDPQGLMMRRSRETGGRAGFLQRFLAIRFFSTTEKLVLALLYVSGFAILSLTGWAASPAGLPAAASAGTLLSATALDGLEELDLHGETGQFIQGYLAQTAGSSAEAELHYRAAPRYAPALNNLGVLTADDTLFETAALYSPGLRELAWNRGDQASQPLFDQRAGLERPALVTPTAHDFRTAQFGDWQSGLTRFFRDPAGAFRLDAHWAGSAWVWYGILGLYLLLGVLTVLWLLVPRPRMARNAPRSAGYHLLAVLVPGSGMADEVWGILLLVPWGIFGVDLVWRLAFGTPLLDLAMLTVLLILAVLYAVNLVAFTVEYASYRRRMRQLFRSSPEAGIAYGKRIEPVSDLP